jgi:hypothetical protein
MAHPFRLVSHRGRFLDWNGTELVCERSHTLLHIPEIPTSWSPALTDRGSSSSFGQADVKALLANTPIQLPYDERLGDYAESETWV